jgi:hypothetical protein
MVSAEAAEPLTGGSMSDVTVKRLEGIVPTRKGGEEHREVVDPKAVVLWAGDKPAAVLAHSVHADFAGAVSTEELVRVGSGPGGPFPLKNRILVPALRKDLSGVDAWSTSHLVRVDLDGDGVEELVLPRRQGGVEVVGTNGKRFDGPGPGRTRHARYEPVSTQVAQLGSGAVVHVLLRREPVGEATEEEAERSAPDAYAILRVDAKGVKRIVLGDLGWKPTAVMAVGAINRPGSAEVDELVVLSQKDRGEDVFVSRHRPDGTTLGPPRKIYVPFSPAVRWALGFVPQSRVTVVNAWSEATVYFVTAEKPVNWIRLADVGTGKQEGKPQFLGVADGQAKPKAIMRLGPAVYAVDEDGTYYAASGGSFVPVNERAPFYRIPEVGGFPVVGVFPSVTRGDEFLVVRSRAAGAPQPSHEEIAKAADRFLSPETLARVRQNKRLSLTDRLPQQDELIAAEKKSRGITHEITTLEQWKRELPDSYRKWSEYLLDEEDGSLWVNLTLPLSAPDSLNTRRYREIDTYRAWLVSATKPAETSFELIRRGARVREVRAPGELANPSFSDLTAPIVSWREGKTGLAVVTTLVSDATKESAFFEVRQTGGAR